jgi:dTMP kinase
MNYYVRWWDVVEVRITPVFRGSVSKTICGEVVATDTLISPLGDLDPEEGYLRGVGSVASKIVVIKGFTGSTVGPYVIYSMVKRGKAPKVLVAEVIDASTVASAVLADIPLYKVDDLSRLLDLYRGGARVACIEGEFLRFRGILIAIEGLDGAGKTSLAKALHKALLNCGFRAVYTYEPYSNAIREIFELGSLKLTPEVEALLMVADRYSHYAGLIRPELSTGAIVILDRYIYSTLAYQGSLGVDIGWLESLHKYLPEPDLCIYLDVDPELGLKRKVNAGSYRLRYFENVGRLRRAREIYLDLVSKGKMVLVDSSQDLPTVVRTAFEIVKRELGVDLRRCYPEVQ